MVHSAGEIISNFSLFYFQYSSLYAFNSISLAADQDTQKAIRRSSPETQKRVALVSGNGDYKVGPLQNPAQATETLSSNQKRAFNIELQLDPKVVAHHKQLYNWSCIPMAVEYVLKLLKKMPTDDFRLQEAWGNDSSKSFAYFHEKTIRGVKFRRRFTHKRDKHFPLDRLFHTIEEELSAGRYVIVSLKVTGGWHMYIIYGKLPNGNFRSVTKGRSEKCDSIQDRVRAMKGTDILTYEVVQP